MLKHVLVIKFITQFTSISTCRWKSGYSCWMGQGKPEKKVKFSPRWTLYFPLMWRGKKVREMQLIRFSGTESKVPDNLTLSGFFLCAVFSSSCRKILPDCPQGTNGALILQHFLCRFFSMLFIIIPTFREEGKIITFWILNEKFSSEEDFN